MNSIMMWRRLSVIGAALACLWTTSGCGSKDEASSSESQREQIIADLKARADKAENENWGHRYKRGERNFLFSKAGYDVRKSDSLVRPYEGELVVHFLLEDKVSGDSGINSQGQRYEINPSVWLREGDYILSVAYENGKWFPYQDQISITKGVVISDVGTPDEGSRVLPTQRMEPFTDEWSRNFFAEDIRQIVRSLFGF